MAPLISSNKPVSGFLVEYNDASRKLEFEYNPEFIRESRNPNYAAIIVPGMSHPYYHFTNGGERRIEFTLQLYYQTHDGKLWEGRIDTVKRKIDWLMSLTYPSWYPSLSSAGLATSRDPVQAARQRAEASLRSVRESGAAVAASQGTLKSIAPPLVVFSFGEFYQGVLCIVRQVEVEAYYQFDPDTLLPLRADVSVVLEENIT